MASKEFVFLQKLLINGTELAIDNMILMTYIERSDLSGPALTMQLRDSLGMLIDQYGIKEGSKLELEMIDILSDSGASFKESFSVGKPTKDGGAVTMDALQWDCMALKKAATKPRFFNQKSPADIIKSLIPGLPVVTDITDAGTYHLNTGMTPSRLLRVMARDYAAAIYICRGKVYFKSLTALAKQEAAYKMGTNKDSDVDIIVANSSRMDEKGLYERTLRRSWYSFDYLGGVHQYSAQGTAPGFASCIPARRLKNQNSYLVPRLDVTTNGFAPLQPGLAMSIQVVKTDELADQDETVPVKLILSSVSHYQQGMKYLNRIELSEVISE